MAGNLLSEHNITPPWEKVHSAAVKVYFGFLVIFGISSLTNTLACLPSDAEQAEKLTAPEAQYVSSNCKEQYGRKESDIMVIIGSLLNLEALAAIILAACSRDSFRVFTTAEKKFQSLEKSETTGRNHFDRLLNDPFASELRELARLFSRHEAGKVMLSMLLRDIILLCGLVAADVALWLLGAPQEMTTSYLCNVEYDFTWSSNVSTNFTCEIPGASGNSRVAIFFSVALTVDVIVRSLSVCHLIKFLLKSKPNRQIHSARSLLFVNSLFIASRSKDQRNFGEFVHHLLSHDSSERIHQHIESTGSDADPLMTKFVTSRRRATVDHHSHGNDSDQRLILPVSNTDASFDGDDVSLLSFGDRPNVNALVNERRWRWITFLADKNFVEVEAPETFSQAACDDEGNSLLFYALQLVHEGKILAATAVKILEQNNEVYHNGIKMSAEEYIEDRFATDPTYPERLKDRLIRAIKASVKAA